MTPRILKSAAHHREALLESARIEKSKPARGTASADKLELLKKLVRDYEHMRLAKSCPDPLAAIRHRMHERGLKQKDLIAELGGKNRVSEVLAGKRALTIGMIRAVGARLDIPVELLIRKPAARSTGTGRKKR